MVTAKIVFRIGVNFPLFDIVLCGPLTQYLYLMVSSRDVRASSVAGQLSPRDASGERSTTASLAPGLLDVSAAADSARRSALRPRSRGLAVLSGAWCAKTR